MKRKFVKRYQHLTIRIKIPKKTNQKKILKLKSQVTCSYCSKIFKDLILLPCDEHCREHLSEKDVVKESKLKCKQCNEEIRVKDIEF